MKPYTYSSMTEMYTAKCLVIQRCVYYSRRYSGNIFSLCIDSRVKVNIIFLIVGH